MSRSYIDPRFVINESCREIVCKHLKEMVADLVQQVGQIVVDLKSRNESTIKGAAFDRIADMGGQMAAIKEIVAEIEEEWG